MVLLCSLTGAAELSTNVNSVLRFIYVPLLIILGNRLGHSNGYVFNDGEQAKFVNSLEDYRIILPTRVQRSGEFISHNLHPNAHHRIIKRGVNVPSGFYSDNEHSLFYNITLDINRTVHLELKPNKGFLGKQVVVERWKSRYGNLSDVTVRKLKEKRGCHFVGHVRGEASSTAAVATCDGLMGYFVTGDGEFLIEPVKGHQGSLDQGHPHLVYKRSAIPVHLGGESYEGSCGVKEGFEKDIRRRQRWERHRRNADQSERQNHHRRKRSISTEKYVETLVVIDPIMVEYYANSDLETYVLTIMNMVSNVFHDASIGNAINIVLVKIILLEEDQDGLKISHHADNSLISFCKWQKKLNPKDEEHANHHDVAILITRKNICSRMNRPCGTLGLAQVAALCQPHRSCNINEDTGLALAYTITHELGHNFGMRHDGVHNDCESPNTGRQHVMAPHLMSDSVPLVWSSCSRLAITRFLDRNWGFCLEDEPSSHDFVFPVLPPGTMYDAEHQCRLQYGPDAAVCDGIENVCDTLWCRVSNGCSTKLEAAVEGTLCGDNRWCMNGVCQMIGDRPEAINGEWGVWGESGDCSRTCGGGVSHSQRHCDNPPPSNGGKYCIGERKRYRMCHTEPCSEDAVNFRQYQCSEFDKKPYKKKYYQWEPVSTANTPCQLHCKPRDNYFSVLLKDIVTDGTSCSQAGHHKCIGGRCRHVGCDWVLDSKAKDDRCGVCHGDGSSCLMVKQQFKDIKGNGYVEATVIPEGARNIRVEEVAEANNYLALRSDGGDYYLNGNWFIQWSGDYEVAGTVVQYRRIGNKESFEAPGPLKEPLHIMLLFQSDNPGVVFEYTVPNENATDSQLRPEFHWEFTDFSHCTVSCGGGSQRSYVVCMEREAGHVDDRYCNITTKQDDMSRTCNMHQCPARWWLGPWQRCSATCGDNGIRRRTVICVRSLGPDEQIALEDSACVGQEKPATVEPCRKKPPCPEYGKWVVGDWQNTCNGNPCAHHKRPVDCDHPKAGCDPKTKPKVKQRCGNITCGVWEEGLWSQCTRSCGKGMQYRNVYCDGGQSCDLEREPPAERHCMKVTCPLTTTPIALTTTPIISSTKIPLKPSPTTTRTTKRVIPSKRTHAPSRTTEKYTFLTVPDFLVPKILRNGTETSLTSSTPTSTTLVTTRNPAPENIKVVENIPVKERKNIHVANSHKETDIKSLNINNEPVIKLTGNNNGLAIGEDFEKNFPPLVEEGGYESDRITNTEVIQNEKPTDLTHFISKTIEKPKQHSLSPSINVHNLNLDGESPSIIASVDSEILLSNSAKVADVVQIRGRPSQSESKGDNLRKNRGDNSHQLNSQENSETPKPFTYKWKAGEWSKCSKHCGGGVKTRSVWCTDSISGNTVEDRHCEQFESPENRESCHTMACREWIASDWQPCSEECGPGVKKRHVHCPAPHRCDANHRPAHLQPCQIKPCLNWQPGEWSLCTRTCGKGEQLRLVECLDVKTLRRVSGCVEEDRPTARQSCTLEECPVQQEVSTSPCLVNKMGYKLCEALKVRGQCERSFVQRKCCKSCGVKSFKVYKQNRRKPDRRFSPGRR